MFQKYQMEIKKLAGEIGEYSWDELEELISEAFEDEKLTSEEYDSLMKELMAMELE